MAKQQPSANTGLRLPPFARSEVQDVLTALERKGETVRKQEDLFAVLIHRATALIGKEKALAQLGKEIREHRAKADAIGY